MLIETGQGWPWQAEGVDLPQVEVKVTLAWLETWRLGMFGKRDETELVIEVGDRLFKINKARMWNRQLVLTPDIVALPNKPPRPPHFEEG